MQGKGALNTFEGGMVQDSDVLYTPSNSYRDSMNGRLIFNKDGSYSWITENGGKISVAIRPRNGADSGTYYCIGNTGNDNIVVLFLVRDDEAASEIGLLSVDEFGIGSYKTLFNDQDDPNGDSLNFLLKNQIEARFIYENPKCIRAYWVDGVEKDSNQPRTVTFSYDENIGNPSDVNAYSGNNLSVFAMNSQTDFHMGMIKYVRDVGGGLLSGVYQYTYRLKTKEGYRTPWYPVTRRVFVAGDGISSTNWNEYEMGSSGLTTSKGNRVEIKGIDTRYDSIEVAYVYATTVSNIDSAKIFINTTIDGNDILSFDHTGNIGEPIVPEEIAELFSGIVGAKTLNIKDSTLYYGNIKENALAQFDPEPILANLQMEPMFKDMRSDEWANSPQPSPLPLSHGYPRSGITQLRNHNSPGGTEDYVIGNDYLNYKGTQVDHLYAGYFRGETYRFAIVFYDKLGFKSFAYHIGDFKFPNQTEKNYSWDRVDVDGNIISGGGTLADEAWPTNNYNHSSLRSEKVFVGDNGGNLAPMNSVNPSLTNDPERAVSHLRIMGLKISGIDVSSISSQISGFKIVRVERDSTILAQGMILPCVTVSDDDDGSIITPLPAYHQDFYDFARGTSPDILNPPLVLGYNGQFQFNRNGNRFELKGYASVLYCPAVDFGSISWPNQNSQDEIRLIGGAWDEYQGNASPSITGRGAGEQMKYIKQYYSKNNFHFPGFSSNPFPRYGSKMEEIVKTTILGIREFEEDWDGVQRLNNDCKVKDIANDERRSHGKWNSIFIKHGNFIDPTSGAAGFGYSPLYRRDSSDGTVRALNDAGVSNSSSPMNGSFIFNYIRPNANPYGGLTPTALEQSIFYGTGHFQPINNPTFDAQGMPVGLNFDGIEVYGGDCYLDYHSFLRLYPHSQWDGAGSEDDDYSDGRMFPYEYEFNHSMREANGEGGSGPSLIWANVGARTWRELTGTSPLDYPNGLYSNGTDDNDNPEGVWEEFNLNSVMAYQELLVFFAPKPVDFKDNDRFPVRWRYSREKVYGDPVDNWRLFQVNDFRDLNGEHGEITSSLYIFNQIYSWQISAFGRLRASDRALIESQQGGTLSTGIGDKLDGIDYISTEVGNQHQWGLFKSDTAAYWIDVNKRKLMRFAQDGKVALSDVKGVHQFLEYELPLFEDVDNPVSNRGLHGTFDYGNNHATFTFNRDRRLNASSNGDIPIISRTGLGKTYSPYIVEQNQTAEINPAQNGQPVYLPNGNVGYGINENTILYLFITDGNPWTADVYNIDNSGITLLFQAIPGTYYRLFRHSITDPWQYEEVNANDTTPHKSTITFDENGNYFNGYHSFAPTHYINTKFLLLSNYANNVYANDNALYAHDLGLKADWPSFSKKSYLSVSMNEDPMNAKAMDSIRLNCNLDYSNFLDTMLMQTESQFRYMSILNDSRKRYREDILRFPLRTLEQKDRMRGKHILMTFEMKNNFNHNDRITNLVTYYRTSNRI